MAEGNYSSTAGLSAVLYSSRSDWRNGLASLGLILAIPFLVSLTAVAQDGSGNGAPLDGYAGKGIKSSNTLIYPSLYVGATYDSNLFQTDEDVEDDLIMYTDALVGSVTEFRGLKLTGNIGINFVEYLKNSENDNKDFFLDYGIARQLSPQKGVFLRGSVKREEDPGLDQNEDIPTNIAEPVPSTTIATGAGLTHKLKYGNIAIEGGHSFENFDDVDSVGGDRIDQDFRDQHTVFSQATIDYAPSRFLASQTIAKIEHNEIRSKETEIDRDFTEWSLGQSIVASLSPKFLAELTGGLRQQDFEASEATDSDILKDFGARLVWLPNRRMKFELRGNYEELGVDFEEGIGSGTKSKYVFAFEHKLRRNLLMQHSVGYESSLLGADDLEEISYSYTFAAQYEFNRQAGLSLGYFYEDQESERAGETYERYGVRASLNLRH